MIDIKQNIEYNYEYNNLELLQYYFEKKNNSFIALYNQDGKPLKYIGGFSGGVASGTLDFGLHRVIKKTRLSVVIEKYNFHYFVGNKNTEDQDLAKGDYITISYQDIKENCTVDDFLKFIDSIDMTIRTEKI